MVSFLFSFSPFLFIFGSSCVPKEFPAKPTGLHSSSPGAWNSDHHCLLSPLPITQPTSDTSFAARGERGWLRQWQKS